MDEEETKTEKLDRESGDDESLAKAAEGEVVEQSDSELTVQPAQLGATKYVHAAFFAAAILIAFLSGKILALVWNILAEWQTAVRAVPQLLKYAEDERPTFTMSVGALIGLITVVQIYRKEKTRQWADEVAAELAKVVWPERETVTNGTIVVIIGSVIATVYIGLLDRFWGFLTTLVYGA